MILHITSLKSWSAAQRIGEYHADSLGEAGFIHCSKPDQILRVANTFYAGQRGLALLVIDPGRLKSELLWEPGADTVRAANTSGTPVRDGTPDELFPHIHGPLNTEAVVDVLEFEPDEHGQFNFPVSLITGN